MRKLLSLALCCVLLTGCTATHAAEPENGVSRMPLRAILDQMMERSELHLGGWFSSSEPEREEIAYAIGAEEMALSYEEALLYGPTVGVSAFVLLLFRLEAGADTSAFADTLRQSADCNCRAYCCADFAETAVNGQIVLFLMADNTICPEEKRAALYQAFAEIDPLAYDPGDYAAAAKPVILLQEASPAELLEGISGDCAWLGAPPYQPLREVAALSGADTVAVTDSAVYTDSAGLCGLVRLESDAALSSYTARLRRILTSDAGADTVLIVYGSQIVGFCRAARADALAATGAMIHRYGLVDYDGNFTD
jgi:hypothetical protein